MGKLKKLENLNRQLNEHLENLENIYKSRENCAKNREETELSVESLQRADAVLGENEHETDSIIENLDKEFDEISGQVDSITQAADNHLNHRLYTLGEKESEAPSVCSIKSSKIKDNSSIITREKMSSVLGKREQDVCDAQERLKKFEDEQRQTLTSRRK